jgi:hypothetical protein
MDIEKLNKLETVIGQKDYEKANRDKGNLWNGVGYFMQFINILICLLGLVALLTAAFGEFSASVYIYYGISSLLLLGWELLKRNTVTDITFGYMRSNGLKKSLTGGLLLALALLVGSGYLAVHGIQEITDKSKQEEKLTLDNTQVVIDSLNVQYGTQIKQLEERIDFYYAQAQSNERALYKKEVQQVDDIESKIKTLKDELGLKVANLKNESEERISNTKEDIGGRVITFLIITIAIEVFIALSLIKVAVINFNSYVFKIGTSEYKAFKLNSALLDIFYNNGKHTEGEDCPSLSKFEDLIKLKGMNLSKTEVNLFLTLLKAKDIVSVNSNKRRFAKTYKEAQKEIVEYYGFN